jgi:hypothetical protein
MTTIAVDQRKKVAGTVIKVAWNSSIGFLLIGLILSQLWSFYKIDQLVKDVNYVTPLAENANNFAHSHYSDIRLKTGILPLPTLLEKVLQLQAVNYYWRPDLQMQPAFGNQQQVGFIAQDVQKLFPELVKTDANGYLTIDYEKMTPILVKALQEQQLILEDLETRMSTLEK